MRGGKRGGKCCIKIAETFAGLSTLNRRLQVDPFKRKGRFLSVTGKHGTTVRTEDCASRQEVEAKSTRASIRERERPSRGGGGSKEVEEGVCSPRLTRIKSSSVALNVFWRRPRGSS